MNKIITKKNEGLFPRSYQLAFHIALCFTDLFIHLSRSIVMTTSLTRVCGVECIEHRAVFFIYLNCVVHNSLHIWAFSSPNFFNSVFCQAIKYIAIINYIQAAGLIRPHSHQVHKRKGAGLIYPYNPPTIRYYVIKAVFHLSLSPFFIAFSKSIAPPSNAHAGKPSTAKAVNNSYNNIALSPLCMGEGFRPHPLFVLDTQSLDDYIFYFIVKLIFVAPLFDFATFCTVICRFFVVVNCLNVYSATAFVDLYAVD